jgi:hypothetical protein
MKKILYLALAFAFIFMNTMPVAAGGNNGDDDEKNDPSIKIEANVGLCTQGGRSVAFEGEFKDAKDLRASIKVEGSLIWGPFNVTGDDKDFDFSLVFAPGDYDGEAILEKYVHFDEVKACHVHKTIDGHDEDVSAYYKHGSSDHCVLRSWSELSSDLKNQWKDWYGSDNAEHNYGNHNSLSSDVHGAWIVITPEVNEWQVVKHEDFDFEVDLCKAMAMMESSTCAYGFGTDKTFLVTDGLTMHIVSADGSGSFDQDLTAGSTTINFPNGHYAWTLVADQGYVILGPAEGDFWTDDFTCRPEPACPTCGPRVEEIANAPDDLVIVNYGRGPCTICWTTWTADKEEYWRYGRSIHQFSIQVFVPEQQLIDAGIAYRTVPYANHPDYKPMLYIDSVPFVGLDGVTYYILDLNKAVVGKSWAYYDTATGSPYREIWGWQSLDRSAYTDCSRTVGPWDISAAGLASRQYGNPTSSDWVQFMIDNGYDANAALQWSLALWVSPDGTLALPADFVLQP